MAAILDFGWNLIFFQIVSGFFKFTKEEFLKSVLFVFK